MQTTHKNSKIIAFIGKFNRLWDEEYIARSFEMLGCTVIRLQEDRMTPHEIIESLEFTKPDIVMWTKLMVPQPEKVRDYCMKYITVCWVFDLYFNYVREYRLTSHPAFTADYVFTTDGGNDERFKKLGINHKCVRQGIYSEECHLVPHREIEHEIIFVGSLNPHYPERNELIKELGAEVFGNKEEVRGMALNELYASTRIVIGDSYPSKRYWSNRIVETLGRGGFLIHKEVEGLKEEYPYLVTYTDKEDLKRKIEYYKEYEAERRLIIKQNHRWVANHYTMDRKCREILNYIS